MQKPKCIDKRSVYPWRAKYLKDSNCPQGLKPWKIGGLVGYEGHWW